MKFHLLPISILLVLSFVSSICAEEPGWIVEANGSARIIDGDVQAATAQAERDALRNALQYQIGVNIQSVTVVQDAELVVDVVDAHVEGYARKLAVIEAPHRDPQDPDTICVKLQVWVSPNVHKVAEKLANPRVLFVGVTIDTDDLEEKYARLAQRKFLATVRSMLIEAGYEITWLADAQLAAARQLIEKLAETSIVKRERAQSAAELWSSGLGDLADLFVLGEVGFSMRDADLFPGTEGLQNLSRVKVVNLDGSVQGIRLDVEREAARLVIERLIETKGMQKPDRAIRLAIEDAKPAVEALIEEIKEKMGAPNRLVVLYVKGLQRLEDYEELQEKLTQYDAYGVEKVRGVVFDKALSKYVLTFSQQALVSGDLVQRVKYLATVINQSSEWRVIKRATHTLMIERKEMRGGAGSLPVQK